MAHRATYVVDGRFFGHFVWKVEGSSAHTHESHAAHVWQFTCMVITIWWRGALTCDTWSSHVAINVHSNYYMVDGSPHMWQLTCTVITTIWWRGALTYGSHVAINMHRNYYYIVEGSPHVWQLMCTEITRIWWRGPLTCGQLMCTVITRIWWLTIKST